MNFKFNADLQQQYVHNETDITGILIPDFRAQDTHQQHHRGHSKQLWQFHHQEERRDRD